MTIKAENAPVERYYLGIGIAATMVFALVLAVMTLSNVSVKSAPGTDKIYHVLAFAVLAFPLPFVRPKLTAMVVVVAIAYGGAIEIIQPFFGRQAELADLLADAVGTFIGATSGFLASRWAFWRI
ncbi:VanZ family protein [Aliiruegeria sabulilitoris]|uniref:VanZ family protein n=1 Tax=Aliiruegeria sabulilitoris TaxID=1510458 RepID=UPI0008310178|nr:VanZ family protein [Aliiruegeria sabulilitoris]NDR55165.1 VanZ family protein [Pseudoruegeria sp. M32A2M]